MMIEHIWPILPNRNPARGWIDRLANCLVMIPGFCNVCGRITVFNAFHKNFREHVACLRCGSRNRQRQIVAVLLAEQCRYEKKKRANFASVRSLPKDLVIWNAEATRALHGALKTHLQGNYIFSEYIDPELKSGDLHDGVMHVDMQKTNFQDCSINYILSGDVLEHMPDPVEALRESFRILKPGGSHIFTVPFYHHRFTIERRSELMADGVIKHHKKPWFHDDPVRPTEGALVFNVFAPELLCEIEKIGFEARLLLLHSSLHGVYGSNGIVIVARKSMPADHDRDWIYS